MKPARNDPCPCGSGRKYKQCCASATARRFDIAETMRTAMQHHDRGSLATAEALYQRILLVQPENPAALGLLGAIALATGHPETALTLTEKAIALEPAVPGHRNNCAEACRMLGRLEEAVAHCNAALALGVDTAEVRCSLGNALVGQLKLGEAMVQFKAIALKPDFAFAHWCLSMALLLSGDYARGWLEHEWRWQWKEFPSPRRILPTPQWNGSDLSGRRILLYAEQGFGDAIQFVRYAALAAERAARVIVECKPALVRLLATMDGVDEVVERGAPLPLHDVHCPLSSLPLMFRTTADTIPARIPYLHAAEPAAGKWQARLRSEPPAFKVGIAWSGNPAHVNDRQRSCPLLDFAPLAEIPGTRLYSLQMGRAAAQARGFPGSALIDVTGDIDDFADTAAFIQGLDLVISVDTAVAHLGGALGKPVWLLLPFSPDWRWLLERTDSPWYPGMRLFRQPVRGDWKPPMERIAAELRELAAGPKR